MSVDIGDLMAMQQVTDPQTRRHSDDPTQRAISRAEMLLVAGRTRRYHQFSTIKDNTVAEHSWSVAGLVYVLTDGECTQHAMMAAIVHDMAEVFIGDVPAPVKRALGLREALQKLEDRALATAGLHLELSIAESAVLKLADCLDGMMFCVREARMGNRTLEPVALRFSEYVRNTLTSSIGLLDQSVHERAGAILNFLHSEYRRTK